MPDDLAQTSQTCLEEACAEAAVTLVPVRGKIAPAAGDELKFLSVLDRRRYATTLIDSVAEVYEAANRRRET